MFVYIFLFFRNILWNNKPKSKNIILYIKLKTIKEIKFVFKVSNVFCKPSQQSLKI